jgi:hypothetical protein
MPICDYFKTDAEVVELVKSPDDSLYFVSLKNGKILKVKTKNLEILDFWQEKEPVRGLAVDHSNTLYYSTNDTLKVINSKSQLIK